MGSVELSGALSWYDTTGERITTAGYSYDADGNRTADPNGPYTHIGARRTSSGMQSLYVYEGTGNPAVLVTNSSY